MEKEIIKVIDFWLKTLKSDGVYPRSVLDKINFDTKEIVVLTGARRSGKSSILNLIINKLKIKDKSLYINFEDPFFVENNSPLIIEKIINVYKEYFNKDLEYLFFDEIQNINKWENALRKLRDSEYYKIFVTGSSSKLLSREISSLITGRHLSYEVLPLSFKEFLSFNGLIKISKKDLTLKETEIKNLFAQYAQIGGFPEVVIKKDFQLLKNYFYDILYKDIMARYNIREKDILEKMLLFLLSNFSKIVTVESLKNNYKISFETASNYMEYIRESFLIFSLTQFSYSLKAQTNFLKKNYAIDMGLAKTVSFRFSENNGRILENLVFLELRRREKEVFYYKGNKECDFIVKDGVKLLSAIQVSQILNNENRDREISGLLEAMESLKISSGMILTEDQEEKIKIKGKKIDVFPIWKWMLIG